MIDRFETRVYYSQKLNRFLTVKWRANATPNDRVVVGMYATGEIIMQRYRNQANYLGVVSILDLYEMPGAQRWKPAAVGA